MANPALNRILHVDDQPDIRGIVRLSLGKVGGFTVRSCGSGDEALAIAPEFNPDLLLLDMSMPDMDGMELLERLRAADIHAPAIFFTAKANSEDIKRYRAGGAIGTVAKPFDPLKLGRQIKEIWSQNQGWEKTMTQDPRKAVTLDFTTPAEESEPEPPPLELPADATEEEVLIGSRALGTEGFHLVAARRSGTPAADPATQVVLVIDDDVPTGELAARALRRAGFRVEVVASPQEGARYMARLGAPALVILDIEMPGLSGFDFLAKMRSNNYLKNTPVILFTVHSERRDIVRGLLAGADGYIAKPISSSALVSAVKTVLSA